MKKFLILFLSAAGLALAPGKSPKPNFRSDEGRFAIWFEQKPEQSSQSVPTDAGDILVTMFMFEKSQSEVYLVSYNDYPEKLINGGDPLDLLEGARSGVVENIKGRIIKEKKDKFNGNPSIEFTAEGDGISLAYKLILVDNRLYQVGILKDGKISRSDSESFIGSFELI